MEAIPIVVELIHIIQAIRESLQAAQAYTRNFDSAINKLERTRRLLDNLGRTLTPREAEQLADWKVDCEVVLTDLQARSGSVLELQHVGIWNAVATFFRRLCFDSRYADALSHRLSTHFAHLNVIISSILLGRR